MSVTEGPAIDLSGVVDLYFHASPDLLPRQSDDIALAAEFRDAGLRAAMHRSHFSITAERAALARTASAFDMLGAVIVDDHVGGLDPVVVETALRCGARWVGMPTLSAAAFRQRLAPGAPYGDILGLGPGKLTLIDEEGALRPEVRDILDLAAAAGVPVGLGYGTASECMALCIGAAEAGVDRLVLTYPDVMGLTDAQIAEIVERPGVFLELCAFTIHPDGFTPDLAIGLRGRALGWLAALGPGKMVASSDGGMVGIPGPVELLRWVIGWLSESDVATDAIDQMVRSNPAHIVYGG